jgi:hypothetical protein
MTDNLAKELLEAKVDDDDLAYDGSNEPQARELTARERDILCRIISDILHSIGNVQHGEARFHALMRCIRLYPKDGLVLAGIRDAIDPRRD